MNLADEVAATQRAIRPQAVALAVFAGLAGLISLAVLGQLLARQLALDSAEFPILRAVGMTRGSLLALAMARLALVTVAGAVVAVAIAIAASPLMPIGSARLAEPDPGVEVNVALLGAGFAVIALLPLAVLAPAAWRVVRHSLGAPGSLGVAEPGLRPDAAVAAGGRADVGRAGDERGRRADGVRAGARQDRGAGAQRPGGQRDRAHRAGGRRRLRR